VRVEGSLPEIHVQPGESHLIREPAILCTLLGSCVGITFWVRRLRIGALCHPMLPNLPVRRNFDITEVSGRRYVDFAVRDMAAQFDALGVKRSEIEVKLFGGADVLEYDHRSARPTVGRLNGEAAMSMLSAGGYAMGASSLGGDVGVQIRFNTSNGEVRLRRFGRAEKAGARHRPRSTEREA
jgi:chemotaxis protein CheD